MRAARAARNSIDVDGLAFRGTPPPPEDDVVVMPKGKKVRASRLMYREHLAPTSSRAPTTTTATSTMTNKPKRAPKGSAAKRSRALRTTLEGVVGGSRRGSMSNDVTSRFPMPYPGVERDRPPRDVPVAGRRASHHRAKLKSPEEHVSRADRPGREPPLRMPVGSPGVTRKHRKRPRSAVLAPSHPEFGRPAAPPPTVSGLLLVAKKEKKSGNFSSSRMKRTADNNNAELAEATSSMPHGGRVVGGGKKTMMRPRSAPSRRGGIEKSKKGAGGGGVLKVLSHISDGHYKTPDELRIMKWVVLRETYLTKLHGVVSAGRKRAKTASKDGQASNGQNDAKRRPKLFALLTELLSLLRRITVEIVEAVERWRGGAGRSNRPFIWGSSNYLVKAAGDTAFLSRLPGLEQHLGVAISENPFLCHVRLDGRPAYLPPMTTVVAGKDRGKAAGHGSSHPVCFGASVSLGVSAERLEAAAAVLYNEVIRASGGSGGEMGGGGDESGRSHKPAPAGSSRMCRPAWSGLVAPPEVESDPGQPQRPRSSVPGDNTAADPDPDPDPPPVEQRLDYYEEDSVGGENRLVNEWRRQVSLEYGARQDSQDDYHDCGDRQINSQECGIRQDNQGYCGDGQDYYGGRQDGQYYYGEAQDRQYYESQPTIPGPTGHQGADSDPHNSLRYQPTASFKVADNTSPQSADDSTKFPESTNEPEQSRGVVDRGALVAGENNLDHLGNRLGGAMGQPRGSPFLDVFNMCDGILSDLKGAGLVSRSTESIYEPCSLVADMGGKRGDPFLSVVGTGDEDDGGSVSADVRTDPEAVHEVGGGTSALRGTAYERQTCNLVAELVAPNFSKVRQKAGGRDREEISGGELATIWNRYTPEELTAKCFVAWLDRTKARQLHRDLKAARHHRHGQLRRAMSVWDKHRATILGGHLAEAFAGRFGLSTRFFVRYAFDALRAHAKGNRVAARNRAAMARTREYLESVGRARLRQALQRWLQAVEIRDSVREDSFATPVPNAGSKDDEWAQWLGDEGSLSCESPSERVGGPRLIARGTDSSAADPVSSAGDGKTSVGQQLSPKLSFRGLGARIRSMRSFRDKGDKTQTIRQQQLRSVGASDPPSVSSTTPRLDPLAHKVASGVIDAFQAQQRGATEGHTTPLHGEGAEQEPVDATASRIQHAWRASREQRVAARITSSASLIQRSWRLRCRRSRAGFQVVRAWRRRSHIRARTLNQALVEAAGGGDLSAVEFLLRPGVGWGAGADPNATAASSKSTALHIACRHAYARGVGGTKEAETLAARSARSARGSGCDECALTETAVKRKCKPPRENRGDSGGRRRDRPDRVGVIRALVEAGAVIEARDGEGFTPMMTAAGEGCGETVVALATAGAELDAAEAGVGRRTPLVIAAQKSNASTTAALLEYGARVDATAADGLTPLHEAVGEGSIAVAEMLVRAGAKVDAKNESAGMTPLHLAVANGQHAAARLLVHSEANVCLPDARGLTPLRLTVEMADAPTVALLLAAEPPPDLSVKDQNGGTILHAACRLGLTDIARLLLEAGADPHARNAHGKTPELLALDLGHSDCAGLFYNMEIHSFVPQGKRQAAAAEVATNESASEDSSDASGERQPPYSDSSHRGTGDTSDAQEGEGEEGLREEKHLDDSEPQRESYPQRQDDNGDETAAAAAAAAAERDDAETSRDLLLGEEEAAAGSKHITWGGSIAVSRARNKWLSLVDGESGSTYYQNEKSGLTQWEAPEEDEGQTGSESTNNEEEGGPDYEKPLPGGKEGDWSSNARYSDHDNVDSHALQAMATEDPEGETSSRAAGWTPSEERVEDPQRQERGGFGREDHARLDDGRSGSRQETYYFQRQDEDDGDGIAAELVGGAETSRDLLLGGETGDGRKHITWAGSRTVLRARNKWLSLIDRESGVTYYQNEQSGLTQWEVPEDEGESGTETNIHEKEGSQNYEESPPGGGSEGIDLSPNAQYSALDHDDGDALQAIAGYQPEAEAPSRAVSRARNKWLSLIDRESGSTYYQNQRSGKTQWEVPEDGGGIGTGKSPQEGEEEGGPSYEEALPGGEEGDWSSNAQHSTLGNAYDVLQATDRESGGTYYQENEQPDHAQWAVPEDGGESGTGTKPSARGGSSATTAVRERNKWVSVIDGESGAVYYQNVESGLTQWEVPDDGTVASPEAGYGDSTSIP